MFQKAKDINFVFLQLRNICILTILASTAVAVTVSIRSYNQVEAAQQRIYILANGKAIEAFAADRKDNIPVEARDHVKMFHVHFFTMDPDEQVIQTNISKALYLADASAKQQYELLKENGYYANMISGNVSQEMQADSIMIDMEAYPYYFRYKGTQKIIRPATIVTRSLVTEGYLRNVNRSDHNPHGFLIERWRTLENKDEKIQNRN